LSVSVIVPAHNEEERLFYTLTSISQQSLSPQKIVIVDDTSTDRTGLIGALYPASTCVRPESLCGSKASAQNFGLQYVESKYVVAVDADTILRPDALNVMVDAMRHNPKATAACAWVMPLKHKTLWQKGRTIEYCFAFFWFKRVQNYLQRPLICSGCLNIFKTNTLRWLGGYPTNTLAEDMDMTWGIYEKHVGQVLFLPQAVAYTDDPETLQQLRFQLARWSCAYWQNLRKHYSSLWRNDKRSWGLVTVGLVDSLAGSLYYPIVAVIALMNWTWALALLIGDCMLIWFIAVLGARRFHMALKTLRFMPGFFALRLVNTFYFLKYMWITGIRGRTIGRYIKGH